MSWEGYLASLVGSWRALAVVSPGAEVRTGPGWVAAVFPAQPVLDNALLLDPTALAVVRACYREGRPWALWTADEPAAAAAFAAGFVPDTSTWPMVCSLADAELTARPVEEGDVLAIEVLPVDAATVAAVNRLDAALLDGVPGLRAYGTADGLAVAALIEVGTDVNVGFVATRPEARRRGRAREVLRVALRQAREDGFRTASLQSTSVGRGVYAGLGFREVGHWQEWLSPDGHGRIGPCASPPGT